MKRTMLGLQPLQGVDPPEQQARPGRWLGRYEIVARLALGGMAEVFLARQGELQGFKTLCVLKRVLPHLAMNPEFISMFLDEARIASRLDHPNVVRIYEVGREGADYFLAMELVQGKPLSSLMRHGLESGQHLEHRLAAYVMAQAAFGLHHAHALTDHEGRGMGIVHRDVSPQNILLSFEGAVKVIDFGVARALGRLADTSSGALKGKIGYMSPEQATGRGVDRRSDIFSLGIVLWEALSGRRLYARDNELATLQAIVGEAAPRPSSLVDIAPDLEEIAMRALDHRPEARFQSAHEMGHALERYAVADSGTSASDLAKLMKAHFREDRAKWRHLTRVALDSPDEMGETPPPITSSVMSLSQMSVPTTYTSSSSASSPLLSLSGAPPRRWPWVLGGAGVAAVLVAVLFLGMRSGKVPAPARLRAGPPAAMARPMVEALPSPVQAAGEAPAAAETPAAAVEPVVISPGDPAAAAEPEAAPPAPVKRAARVPKTAEIDPLLGPEPGTGSTRPVTPEGAGPGLEAETQPAARRVRARPGGPAAAETLPPPVAAEPASPPAPAIDRRTNPF